MIATRAVLLEIISGEPAFLLIYDMPGSQAKSVVEINTWVKRARGRFNTMQTGRLVDRHHLRSDLASGVIIVKGEMCGRVGLEPTSIGRVVGKPTLSVWHMNSQDQYHPDRNRNQG